MPRIPQYNQQTSAPVQYRDPGNVVQGQTGRILGSFAQTAGQEIGRQREITMRNQDLIERAQRESDLETEKTQRLQAKEWADKNAADLDLRKMEAFNRLQASIGADQDFAQEWEKTRTAIDDEATKAVPPTNPFYGEQLRGNIEGQRAKYGAQAINQKFRMIEENSAMNFNALVETKRKILMQKPGIEADAELATFEEELKSNASLSQIEQVRADALEKRAKEEASETVLQNMVKNVNDARTLLSAIDGEAQVHFRRKAGAPVGGKPSIKVAGGKWDAQIAAAGEKYGVPSTLLASMMAAESTGAQTDKNGKIITSEKGALGLMQLMPGTAKDMGVDPSDPVQNIEGGAKYLSMMLDKYGNEPMALAAYNAGPGNVDAAIAKAKEANDSANWMKYLPKPSETIPYVTKILRRADIRGGGGQNYEAVREPAAKLNVTRTASPEQLARYRSVAENVIAQDARARTEATKLEVAERERAEKAAASDGLQIGRPLTAEDYMAAGYSAKDAQIKMAVQGNFQKMAPIVSDLKSKSKAERDAIIRALEPKNTGEAGIDYDAKRDAWKLANAANEEIDRQVKEDPAGYGIRSNPLIANAWDWWNTAASQPDGSLTMPKDKALDSYVAQVEGFQRAQGVESPSILPKTQADAIKAQWYGQEDGPMKAAQTMTQLAQTYGKHYPKILKQLAKDLPSEALWVGQLADDPRTEGIRQQLAAASKVFAKPDQIPQKALLEKSVETSFASFSKSLASTDPAGGTETWSQLREGAVKLAALKVAQTGASPQAAAKQAFDELVATQYLFAPTDRTVASTMSDGTNLQAIISTAMVRIPRAWPGQAPGQIAEEIIPGANAWKREELPALDLLTPAGKSARVHLADVKSRAGWVTSPEDDGLVLMLGSAPVRTADGKPVKISWSTAADMQARRAQAPAAPSMEYAGSSTEFSGAAFGGKSATEVIGGAVKSLGEWFISPSR